MTASGRGGLAEFFFFSHFLSAIKGEPRLVGSSEPVVGLVGHYVVLPCVLQPAASVSERTVEWTRSGLNSTYVYIFRQGRSLYDLQNPSFQPRTILFQHELKNGNMSLKLSDLQLSDEGTYTCRLVSPELETFIRVLVGSFSEPVISQEGTQGSAAVLKCDAKNWYPKPEMEWRDGEGRILPPLSYSDKKQEGRYSVCSRVTVEKTASSFYTCTVRQLDIRQSRETTYTVYVDEEVSSLKDSQSALTRWLIVFGIIILALVLLILMYVCGYRFRCLRRTSSDDQTDGQVETSRLREQVSHLKQQKERLEAEVSRLEEEVEKFQRERAAAGCGHVTNSPGNQRLSLLCGDNNPGDSD